MSQPEITAQQALELWHDVLLALVKDDVPDLSMRQLAVLFAVYMEPPPHTVRGLAEKLGVTKPVITRALDTLGSQKLVDRRRDMSDRRNVLVTRTVEGSLYLESLGDLLAEKAAETGK